jgi:hypothetical protein
MPRDRLPWEPRLGRAVGASPPAAMDAPAGVPAGNGPDMSLALQVARQMLDGLVDFRSKQRDVIAAALTGRDVVAVLPTGAGKTLLMAVIAVCAARMARREAHAGRRKIAVAWVFIPTIALAQSMGTALTRMGVPVALLTGRDPVEAGDISAIAGARSSSHVRVGDITFGTSAWRAALPRTCYALRRVHVVLSCPDGGEGQAHPGEP